MAAKQGSLEILQKIWEWANEELTTEELTKYYLTQT
jgi:endo-1,4-beta-D-glucanase Y